MGQWGSCPEDSEGGQRGRTREPRGQAPTQQGEAGAGNLLGEVTLSRVHGTEGTQVVGRAPVWPRGDRTEHGQEPSVARSLGCGGGPEAERSQWRKDGGGRKMPGVWTDPSGNRVEAGSWQGHIHAWERFLQRQGGLGTHFTDEPSEAGRGDVTCPRPTARDEGEEGSGPLVLLHPLSATPRPTDALHVRVAATTGHELKPWEVSILLPILEPGRTRCDFRVLTPPERGEKAKSEFLERFAAPPNVSRWLTSSRWTRIVLRWGTGVQTSVGTRGARGQPSHLPSPAPRPRCRCCSASQHRSPRPQAGPPSPGEPRCSQRKRPGPAPAPAPSSPGRTSLSAAGHSTAETWEGGRRGPVEGLLRRGLCSMLGTSAASSSGF